MNFSKYKKSNTTEYQKREGGALFSNEYKTEAGHPDSTGKLTVCIRQVNLPQIGLTSLPSEELWVEFYLRAFEDKENNGLQLESCISAPKNFANRASLDDSARGCLVPNDDPSSPRAPDLVGTIDLVVNAYSIKAGLIDCFNPPDAEAIRLSLSLVAWCNESKNGKDYLSIKYTIDDMDNTNGEGDDEIPF